MAITKIQLNLDPNAFTALAHDAIENMMASPLVQNAEFITPEHLFASIMLQNEFQNFCYGNGINWMEMQNEMQSFLESLDNLDNIPDAHPELSLAFINLFKILGEDGQRGATLTCIPDIVCTMSEIEDSFVAFFIRKYFGERYEWESEFEKAYLDDYISSVPFDDDEEPEELSDPDQMYDKLLQHASALFENISNLGGESEGNGQQRRGKQPWEEFATCVNDVYRHHNALIGREDELERTIQILCRKEKNNPLHIGEAGVGKTALVYGLAAKIEQEQVPEALKGYRIYMCDMGSLLAGTSYHGELEKRIKVMMDGMRNHGRCILYIDEIHTIMGSNNGSGNTPNISNLLKPYLEDGSVKFIGSTTYQEYNRNMAKDKGIARRFQQIDILEPSVDETIEIIKGIVKEYESFHGVKYDEEAIHYAVEKSDALIADRFLPDKAIDLIDEAGAYRQLHPLCNKEGKKMSAGRQKVDKALIGNILSKVCKINAKALTEDSNASLRDLEQRVSNEIYGQDEAINQVVRAVKMSKAGLIPSDKPLASLLFVGPTGVGKTELCRVLAKQLGIDLVRFDMSEYTEKHTVAKLIGSPAGYVGYDDGGLLTDAIRKSPNCVLLLDEIEKAHQDIYNILLQVMDYARLTDNKGNKVDFKNVILVMTSNAGAQYAAQAAVGFGGGQTRGEAMMQTVKKTFKPEFLNRLSGTVVFRDMDMKMAELILDKKLSQLQGMLSKKNVTLSLTDDARQLLLSKGYTKQYGAREMDRVIQNLLTPLLMDEILFGSLVKGGSVTVERMDEKLRIKAASN